MSNSRRLAIWDELAVKAVDFEQIDKSIERPTSDETFEKWFVRVGNTQDKPSPFCEVIVAATKRRISRSGLGFKLRPRTKKVVRKPEVNSDAPSNWLKEIQHFVKKGLLAGTEAEITITIMVKVKSEESSPQL
ncbi:MAG: hypothetical protein NTW79_00880 [Candidatus Berkelbacteria bacterium]|nr:hypothetical protein [Candidatus Berkelbacteria bacterium]